MIFCGLPMGGGAALLVGSLSGAVVDGSGVSSINYSSEKSQQHEATGASALGYHKLRSQIVTLNSAIKSLLQIGRRRGRRDPACQTEHQDRETNADGTDHRPSRQRRDLRLLIKIKGAPQPGQSIA
jgi:hypothetical protein